MPDSPPPDKVPLVPPTLLDPVVAYFNPRRVIVFGSVGARPGGDRIVTSTCWLSSTMMTRQRRSGPIEGLDTNSANPYPPAGGRDSAAGKGLSSALYHGSAGTLSRGCPSWMGWWCMTETDPLDHWRRVEGWIRHAGG